MSLLRYLPRVVLGSALAAGCSQSLFDNPGNDDNGPRPDGGNRDAGRPDAGNAPDAAGPLGCPDPCLADAVMDFGTVQGGARNGWNYMEELPDPLGVDNHEMMRGTALGLPAWVGTAVPTPAIAHCPSSSDTSACAGVEDKLLFITSSNAASAGHPTLGWSIPETGIYRLSGVWHNPENAQAGVPHALLIARNFRSDSVLLRRIDSGPSPVDFDVEVDFVQGDILRMGAFATADTGVPVGLSFYVSGPRGPSRCQMATQFAPSLNTQFPDLCGDSDVFVDNVDDAVCTSPPCPATVVTQGPPAQGDARGFVDGSSIQYSGMPNDYSGDFTVQFWARLDPEGTAPEQWLLSDLDCDQQGGVAVRYDLSELSFEIMHEADVDYCEGDAPKRLSITAPAAGEWHYYRIVRNQAEGNVRVCMDGVQQGEIEVPPTALLPTAVPLHLGRSEGALPQFVGALDDLRVFTQALPCPSLP